MKCVAKNMLYCFIIDTNVLLGNQDLIVTLYNIIIKIIYSGLSFSIDGVYIFDTILEARTLIVFVSTK